MPIDWFVDEDIFINIPYWLEIHIDFVMDSEKRDFLVAIIFEIK